MATSVVFGYVHVSSNCLLSERRAWPTKVGLPALIVE